MSRYTVGEVLNLYRKKLDMTLEELASGIMSAGNLSRIERGIAMPSKCHLEALFEKLGVNPNSLTSIFLSKEDAEYQKITDLLDYHLGNDNAKDAGVLIEQLENDAGFMKDKLNRQYIAAAKAANSKDWDSNPAEVLKVLTDALTLPHTEDLGEQIETYFLTQVDFRMFNMMAILHYKLGDPEKAIKILYGLKKNVEKRCIDKIERGRRYPAIIANLTKYLEETGQHKEVIKICAEGRAVCLETQYLELLPNIVVSEACSRHAIGDIETSADLLCSAYHTLKLYERYHEANQIKNYAKDELGIVL